MVATETLLSFRQITKRYPGVTALDDVSIEIAKGELRAIVGENGAGKSTLMKIASGVITEFDGEMAVGDTTVRLQSTRDAEAAGISIIHQELNLIEELSVAANVFLGREISNRWGWRDDHAMQQQAATLLGELECDVPADAAVGALRVGDQQLVEIAKALAIDSRVLIMDEPTSALTEGEVERLFRIIQKLRTRGVTILYISHKMDEVFRLADRITVLRDGRHVATVERNETTPRDITHLMVGREIEATEIGARPIGDVVLETQKLSLAWPGHDKPRLQDISFQVRRGEIVGIAGLMGAGRTELLECLFGASPLAPQGRILIEDKVVKFRHPAEARAAGVALVTEDRKRLGLFADLTVGQNITLCELEEALERGLVNPRLEAQMAEGIVDTLGIRTSSVDALITSLSGGNQQKAIIGRWLLAKPKVLLLDDPTRGIDVGAKAELYRLMDRFCRDGLAIVVTSSELPELLTVSDRILVLCEGKLTGEFRRDDATEQKIMEAATRRG